MTDLTEKLKNKKLLTVGEAADYIGVCWRTFARMVKQRKIPYVTPNKRRMFRREDIDRWLKSTDYQEDPTDFIRGATSGMSIFQSKRLMDAAIAEEKAVAQFCAKRQKNMPNKSLQASMNKVS